MVDNSDGDVDGAILEHESRNSVEFVKLFAIGEGQPGKACSWFIFGAGFNCNSQHDACSCRNYLIAAS